MEDLEWIATTTLIKQPAPPPSMPARRATPPQQAQKGEAIDT
jgi:hypothetical protein